jgi:transcriptional regulator with XRE-family HTH domain
MKLTSEEKRVFLADLRRYMRERDWSISDVAVNTGVHQSQVSRIVAGNFKTFSSNIIKICIKFGMEPRDYYEGDRDDEDQRQIVNSAIAIWDGTRQDVGVVVSLFREIAKLRKQDRKR